MFLMMVMVVTLMVICGIISNSPSICIMNTELIHLGSWSACLPGAQSHADKIFHTSLVSC